MCCWGAPVPLAPKLVTSASTRPIPGPQDHCSLSANKFILLDHYMSQSHCMPPLQACGQPHAKSVLAQDGQDLSQQKGDRPAGVQEWGPFSTGDMTKGFSLDPSRGTCPSLWLHPVSRHRSEGCRRLGGGISRC